jgi:hypothetical protein
MSGARPVRVMGSTQNFVFQPSAIGTEVIMADEIFALVLPCFFYFQDPPRQGAPIVEPVVINHAESPLWPVKWWCFFLGTHGRI